MVLEGSLVNQLRDVCMPGAHRNRLEDAVYFDRHRQGMSLSFINVWCYKRYIESCVPDPSSGGYGIRLPLSN